MKYKLFKISVVLVLILSTVSCKRYLDINTNPNTAPVVTPGQLFSFAITSLVNNRAGGDLFIPMALAGQSMSGGGDDEEGVGWGSSAEDQYIINPTSYTNIWSQLYTSVGISLKQAIVVAESSSPVNNNAAAQCKVMLAETFYETTTIYGDIPFTEALREDIAAPHFDSQETVLNGCLSLLDEAIAQFDPTSSLRIKEPEDMFYLGDIDKWIKVAKAMKLRILMTMVDKDPSKAAEIGELVSGQEMLSSPADNFQIKFMDVAGKRNPKCALDLKYLNGVDFFYASPYVLDPMQEKNDPRIPFFFQTAAEWRVLLDLDGGSTEYHSVLPGADADDEETSKVSNKLHSAAEPEIIFSYQEQLFYEAEAYARGFVGGAPDYATATDKYKGAVEQSALYFGVSPSVAAAFKASLPTLDANNAKEEIATQHWIDKFDRGLDAFTQWRRSGPEGAEVPALELPVGAPSGGLFRRFRYPETNELASNPNAPALVDMTTKMWFDL